MADADSLILIGFGELVRDSQIKPGSGPWVTNDSDGFGEPVPLTTAATQLLLDGSIVTGRQSDNRQISLRLVVEGSPAERAASIAPLIAIIDDQSGDGYQLVYTPKDVTPLSVVFDCFRGEIVEDFSQRGETVAVYDVTIQAFPFTRTAAPMTVTPGSSQRVLNALDVTTGVTASTGLTVAASTDCVEGTHAVTATLPTGPTSPSSGDGWVVAQQTFGSTISLTGFDVVQCSVKFTTTSTSLSRIALYPDSELQLELVDSGGISQRFPLERDGFGSGTAFAPLNVYGTRVAALTGLGPINLGLIKTWRIIWNPWWTVTGATVTQAAPPFTFYADNLVARTAGYGATSTGIYRFANIPGAYRTPVKLDITGSGSVQHLIHHNPSPAPGYDPFGATLSGGVLQGNNLRCQAYQGPHLAIVDGVTWPAPVSGVQPAATITVTATQGALTRKVSQTWSGPVIAGGLPAILAIGPLDLPVSASPDENQTEIFTVDVAITGGGTVSRVLLVANGDGCTTILADATASAHGFYVDPTTPQGVKGRVYNGTSRAAAIHAASRGSGSIHFAPGSDIVAIYGAGHSYPTAISASFYPRFLLERPRIPALDG